ncbi:MAG: hypothetical protein EA398_10065 [Deltaproteobacteria bacterium]|nr:MAG: hypothetical protein EA398_10065 [Deltaproteobacteria bacterium]
MAMQSIESWLPEPAAMGSMELDASFVAALVLFLLVYLFLSNVLIKPYVALVQKRDALTKGTKDAAVGMRAEAERVVSEYEESMKAARLEASGLREELRRSGQQEEQRLVEGARRDATTRSAEARTSLEAQIAEARTGLEQRADELADEIASRVLIARQS